MIKAIYRKLDDYFFNSSIQKARHAKETQKNLKLLEDGLGYKYVVHYKKDYSNRLSELCDKYGSDKGEISPDNNPYDWRSHTYADFYSTLFQDQRKVQKVYENGIGTNDIDIESNMTSQGKPGGSLRVWRDFFPNAIIYGTDIHEKILFEETNIKTFQLDQTISEQIKNFWKDLGENGFDFMLDDGLHTFNSGVTLFNNSIDYLSQNGIYVIEDVLLEDLYKYKSFFNETDYSVQYVTLFRPDEVLCDNSIVVVRKKKPI